MVTKREYINRVLLIMNEAGMTDASGTPLLGADTAQVDRYIEGSFVDAWRTCVAVMPRIWFANKSFLNAAITSDAGRGTGYVVLPDDFYLLTSFKMKGWQKPAYEASVESEKVGAIQSNEYTRGSTIRPVCTITNKVLSGGNIGQVLNYYSLPRGQSEHIVEEAIYVPVGHPLKDVEDDSNLGIDARVLEPLAYLSAASVFTLFEKDAIAKSLTQRAIEMFPGLHSTRGNNVTVKQ